MVRSLLAGVRLLQTGAAAPSGALFEPETGLRVPTDVPTAHVPLRPPLPLLLLTVVLLLYLWLQLGRRPLVEAQSRLQSAADG